MKNHVFKCASLLVLILLLQNCNWFGSKDSASKSKKPKTATTQKATANSTKKPDAKTTPKTDPQPTDPPVIIETITPKSEPKEISANEAQENQLQIKAPLTDVRQFFGPMQWVLSQAPYYLTAQSRRVFIYDQDLKPLTHLDLIDDFANARLDIIENNIMVSVELKGHKLARYIISQIQTDPQIEVIKPIEIQTPFLWIDPQHVISWTKQSYQILNIKPDGTLEIIHEGNPAQIDDVLKIQNTLFISHNNSLELLNAVSFKKLASVSIGRPFHFLGQNKNTLLLGYHDQNNDLYGYQWVKLSDDLLQVKKIEDNFIFKDPLHHPVYDNESGFILAERKTSDHKKELTLFDTKSKNNLRGTFSDINQVSTWHIQNNQYILASLKALHSGQITLDEEALRNKESIQKLIDKQKNTPLAQVGASKRFNDEYNLINESSLQFDHQESQIHLLSGTHLLLLQKNKFDQWSAQSTTNLLNIDSPLSSFDFNLPSVAQPLLKTPIGFFIYSPTQLSLSFIDVNLNQVIDLPIKVTNLISWTFVDSEYGPLLLISSKKPKAKKNKAYQLEVYLLENTKTFERVHTLDFANEAHVFSFAKDSFVVWDKKNASLYEVNSFFPEDAVESLFNTYDKPKTKPYQASEVIPVTSTALHGLTAFKPLGQTGWVMAYNPKTSKPWLVSLANLEDSFELQTNSHSLKEYWASSYNPILSVWVQVSANQFSFFNLQNPKTPQAYEPWVKPAKWSDFSPSANQLCLALSDSTLYCGQPGF